MKPLYTTLRALLCEQGYRVPEYGANEQPPKGKKLVSLALGDVSSLVAGGTLYEARVTLTLSHMEDYEAERVRIHNVLASCVPMEDREEDTHLTLPDNADRLHLVTMPDETAYEHTIDRANKVEQAEISYTLTIEQ